MPDEERDRRFRTMSGRASRRGCLGHGGCSPLSPEIVKLFWNLRPPLRPPLQFSQLRKLAGLDIQRVASGQWAGTARISRCGRPLLRWALYQAALGAARTPMWRARREGLIAKRQGDRFAFLKANVELAAKLLRLVWGVWRSGQPYDPARVDGAPAARPAIASPKARAGRRGPPPLDNGQAEIVEPRGSQAGRVSETHALRPNSGTSWRVQRASAR